MAAPTDKDIQEDVENVGRVAKAIQSASGQHVSYDAAWIAASNI